MGTGEAEDLRDGGSRLGGLGARRACAAINGEIARACNLAGNFGYGGSVDRGPGRHGPGGMLYVYLLDPDGHHIELCDGHYQTIDTEIEPVRWEAASLSTAVRWGLPATERWYLHASPFEGAAAIKPGKMPSPLTLETHIRQQTAAKAV